MLYTTYEKITRFLQRNEKKKNLEQLSEEQIKGEVGVILADRTSIAIANKNAQKMFFGYKIEAASEEMRSDVEAKEKVHYTPYKGNEYINTNYVKIDRVMLMDYLKEINSDAICIAVEEGDDRPIRMWGKIDGLDVCFTIAPMGGVDWEGLSKDVEPDEE